MSSDTTWNVSITRSVRFIMTIFLTGKGVKMNRTRVLQEIRIMRFEELYQHWTVKKLTIIEAAEILGVHERTFRRWKADYEEHGQDGLVDHRLDKLAHNAAPV